LEKVVSGKDEAELLRMSLPYFSNGQKMRGALSLKRHDSNCFTFGAASLRFLYWDLIQNNHCSNSTNIKLQNVDKKGRLQQDVDANPMNSQVDMAFHTWKESPLPKASNNACISNNDISPDAAGQSCSNNNTSNKTMSATKRRKGLGALPSAYRKRNKGLVYDNNVDSSRSE
jgi:hypothetical protein